MADIPLPALAVAAGPRRRSATLDLAREIERREFPGIYCASVGDGLGLCLALAQVTQRISLGTAIANTYTRLAPDYAATTALIHELSGGRFRFGVGVSHAALLDRLGVAGGKPRRPWSLRDCVGRWSPSRENSLKAWSSPMQLALT